MIRKLFSNNKFIPYLLVFGFAMVIFLLTRPGNLVESDDGLYYAAMIRDKPYSHLFVSRHLFFLPLSRLFYTCIHTILPGVDAYSAMVIQSMVFASGMVLLIYFLNRRVLLRDRVSAILITGLVICSYGIWRYSMEADAYLPVLFLLILSLTLAFTVYNRNKYVLAAIVAAVAVLIYQPAVIAALVILALGPGRILSRERINGFVVFFGLIGIGYLAGYLIGAPDGISLIAFATSGARPMPGNPLASIPVVLSNLVGSYWLAGFDWFKAFVVHMFPNKILIEEFYLMNQPLASPVIRYGLVLISFILVGILVVSIYRSVKYRKYWSRNPLYRVLIIWIAVYSLMLLIMDPSSSEPWLIINVPLMILFGGWLIPSKKSGGNRALSILFVLCLFLMNLFGGILLFRDKTYDLTRKRSEWLIRHAGPHDLVIFLGPVSMGYYLSYYGEMQVLDLETKYEEVDRILTDPRLVDGSIYVTADVKDPFAAISYRRQENNPREVIGRLNAGKLKLMSGENIYAVYQLETE